ncbi:hypothetical protein WMY93_003235 [Mugilogobius chulae]|uniref:Sushi domain-containing protein n=1 Tax=Mugilogobius chulae TaxID=88201 RepID=A0AAW0PYS4_9GOBI
MPLVQKVKGQCEFAYVCASLLQPFFQSNEMSLQLFLLWGSWFGLLQESLTQTPKAAAVDKGASVTSSVLLTGIRVYTASVSSFSVVVHQAEDEFITPLRAQCCSVSVRALQSHSHTNNTMSLMSLQLFLLALGSWFGVRTSGSQHCSSGHLRASSGEISLTQTPKAAAVDKGASVTLRCQASSSICPDLPDVPNAQVQNSSVSYQKGDIVNFTCDVGYTSENPVGFVCSSNGWIRLYMGVCQLKPCLPPANITDGNYQIISGNGFVYGTTIKYSCNNGFQIKSGNGTLTCLLSGWSDDVPQCEKQPSISDPQDVDECSSNGSFCEYKCENTVGSFICTCPPGYYQDGLRCKDYDECKSGVHTCTPQQTCVNYKGGYTCLNTIQCPPPYVRYNDRICMCHIDDPPCRTEYHTAENHYMTISSDLSTPADIYKLVPRHSHGESNRFMIKSGNEQQEFSIRQIDDRSAMLVLTRPIRGRNTVRLEVEVKPLNVFKIDGLVPTDHNLSILVRLLIYVF